VENAPSPSFSSHPSQKKRERKKRDRMRIRKREASHTWLSKSPLFQPCGTGCRGERGKKKEREAQNLPLAIRTSSTCFSLISSFDYLAT